MNLFQLNLFVNTVHTGSMKTTAGSFYISQSALSQNIKKLESELGCTLIDRTRSPLKPTLYGKIVLDRAERMLFLAKEFEAEIAIAEKLEPQSNVYYLNLPKRWVAGQVIDNEAEEIVIGATVVLTSLDGTMVSETTTDEVCLLLCGSFRAFNC